MFSQDNMEQVELATEAIDKYIEYRENKSFQKSLLCELCHCISIGISIWCGHTYIGEQKDPNELLIYQGFFYKLSILSVFCTTQTTCRRMRNAKKKCKRSLSLFCKFNVRTDI